MKKQLFLGILVSSIIIGNAFAMKRSHDGDDEPEAKRFRINDSAQECERDDSTPRLDASDAPAPDASGQEATPMQEATPTLQDAPHTPDANTLSHNIASPIQESIASAPNANMPTKTISFADTGLALFDPDAPYYHVPSLAMQSIISIYNNLRELSDEKFSAIANALPKEVNHKLNQFKMLMDASTNQNQKLLAAVSQGALEIVKYLIWNCQANPNTCFENSKMTPLHIAVKNSNVEMIRILLAAKGINVNYNNANGLTPLHLATQATVHTGDDEIMQILIAAGADVDNRGETGERSAPLHYAASLGEGSVLAIQILCAAGADIAIEDWSDNNYTPLHCAVLESNIDAMQTLLSMKADINWRSSGSLKTPLLACGDSNADLETFKKVIHALCQAGAHINDRDALGNNLLLYYLDNVELQEEKESIKIIKYLLEELSFDVNTLNSYQENALISATDTKKNTNKTVRLLLDHHANVNQATLEGKSALHCAAEHNKNDIVQMLCQANAQINARDRQGSSPLHYAARHGNNSALRALCQIGADVNIIDNDGSTPLHYAVDESKKNIILPLLQARASVDILDDQRNTPLLLAVMKYTDIMSQGLDANSLATAREIVKTLTQYGWSQPEPTE